MPSSFLVFFNAFGGSVDIVKCLPNLDFTKSITWEEIFKPQDIEIIFETQGIQSCKFLKC